MPKLALLFALCALTLQAIGQAAQNRPTALSQAQPVSLPHLYWHFLIHQNDLDTLAAKLDAEGKNGQALGNDLQTKLGFSGADYAPIRTASQQLAAELKPINQQLKALQSSHGSASQVDALIAQRESDINNEVYNLSIELSPKDKASLEAFMTRFFAPKTISVALSSGGSSSSKKAVQP